jgi:hypothetical protein
MNIGLIASLLIVIPILGYAFVVYSEIKYCPFCKSGISKKALKCPKCHSSLN